MKRALEQMTRQQLVDVIKKALARYPDLNDLFEVATPRRRGEIDPVQIDRELTQICGAGVRVAESVADWLGVAEDHVRMGRERAATTIYGVIARTVVREFPWIDDPDGKVATELRRCAEGLDKTYSRIGSSRIKSALADDVFGLLVWGAEQGGPVGGITSRTLLIQADPEVVNRLAVAADEALAAATDETEQAWRQRVVELLSGVDLNEAEFIELCQRAGRNGDRVERLLKAERFEEALSVVADAPIEETSALADLCVAAGQGAEVEGVIRRRAKVGDVSGLLRKWLLKRATAQEDQAARLKWATELLWLNPSLERWHIVRETCAPFPEALREVRAELERRRRYDLLLTFSLDDGEMRIAQSAWFRLSANARRSRALAELMAKGLAEAGAPLEACEVLIAAAQHAADGRGRAGMEAAALILTGLKAIMVKGGELDAFAIALGNFRRRNERRLGLEDALSAQNL